MASSSVSVLVFEKQKLRYLLQESPRSAGARIREEAIERLSSRSPDQRLSYCLTTKVNGTGQGAPRLARP
jgi:hypothetical protein